MDCSRRLCRLISHLTIGTGYSGRKYFYIHRIQIKRDTGKYNNALWHHTTLIHHYSGLALFFHNFKDNVIVERIFKGIRPAVVALIAVPTFSMAKSAEQSLYNMDSHCIGIAYLAIRLLPIWITCSRSGRFLWGKLKQ